MKFARDHLTRGLSLCSMRYLEDDLLVKSDPRRLVYPRTLPLVELRLVTNYQRISIKRNWKSEWSTLRSSRRTCR